MTTVPLISVMITAEKSVLCFFFPKEEDQQKEDKLSYRYH